MPSIHSLEMMSLTHKKYKVAICSLGCPKNLVDTENMLGVLSDAGHEIVSVPDEAEVIIVNTCGFIGDAKEESINTILDMAEYKTKGKCEFLIMAGCLAERYHSEIKKELPEVDAVIGTGDYYKIADVLSEIDSKKDICLYGNADEPVPDKMPRILSGYAHSAYLKISEGCDNKCTYCIIPRLRGKYRSRPVEDIIDEARSLAQNGVRELILIAQDTTRYGIDIYGEFSLDKLLVELEKTDGIEWIRLHYCYPEAITDSLLEVMAKSRKICHYLDMPIQHINDCVLKRMGRKSSGAQIKELIEKIRSVMPDITIRTSLITSFPGETEEQFEELLEFLAEYKLDRVGVFAYSKEEDTPAFNLDGQIDEEIKQKRRDKAMEVCQLISSEKNKAKVGKTLKVIADGFDEETMLYVGRSQGDSIDIDSVVYFGAEREIKPGEILEVEILDCDEYDLYGKENVK